MEQGGFLDVAMMETGCLDGVKFLSSNLNRHVGHRHGNFHEEKVIAHNTQLLFMVPSININVVSSMIATDEHFLLEA